MDRQVSVLMARRAIAGLAGAAGVALCLPGAAHAEAGRDACLGLKSLATPSFRVDAAEMVAAGPAPAARPGVTPPVLPEHCLFRATVNPRPSGMDGMTYGVGFELRLPTAWNGRFLFQGGGVLDGVLNPAYGGVAGFKGALERGFAVVSTHGGHRGRSASDARFGLDQQARLDFAYQAVERTTHEAKALVVRYYGQAPQKAYFMGCSTGGREAMMAAQRLPLEFDGVVSGHPTFNLTRIAVNQAWNTQVLTRIAPKDAQGRPILSKAFTPAQLKGVADAVVAECDAKDGLADGMINDYRACRFTPQRLICKSKSQAGACLSPAQADALEKVFGGARDSKGRSIYGTYPFDTGIAAPVWIPMHIGTSPTEAANSADAILGQDTLRYYAMTPPDPGYDSKTFDFDRDLARTRQTEAINDATATYLGTFVARGGKMIVYHGLSDQGMSTSVLSDWYDQLTPAEGGGPQAWARLFLIPGMTHCGGGQATDRFDMLTALQLWVEEGKAPDRVVATGAAFPGLSRPLCPYPKVARYADGDVKDEKSFACR